MCTYDWDVSANCCPKCDEEQLEKDERESLREANADTDSAGGSGGGKQPAVADSVLDGGKKEKELPEIPHPLRVLPRLVPPLVEEEAPEPEDTWLSDLTRPHKTYILTHDTRSAFKLIQYEDDRETDEAIMHFLAYCKDTGWILDTVSMV
jgi:hypothetical protein